MTPAVLLADATGLRGMALAIDQTKKSNLWPSLTAAVSQGTLRFPRDVLDDLKVIAGDEDIWPWASGISPSLRAYTASIAYLRTVMQYVAECGFDAGPEPLDGKDPGNISLARLAESYSQQASPLSFAVVTEDSGSHPLGPSMMELCTAACWATMDSTQAIHHLGLAHLF